MDKLDIDKLKNIPTNLSNLKSKIDKCDVYELVPGPVDLSKLSDVVKNEDVVNPNLGVCLGWGARGVVNLTPLPLLVFS